MTTLWLAEMLFVFCNLFFLLYIYHRYSWYRVFKDQNKKSVIAFFCVPVYKKILSGKIIIIILNFKDLSTVLIIIILNYFIMYYDYLCFYVKHRLTFRGVFFTLNFFTLNNSLICEILFSKVILKHWNTLHVICFPWL